MYAVKVYTLVDSLYLYTHLLSIYQCIKTLDNKKWDLAHEYHYYRCIIKALSIDWFYNTIYDTYIKFLTI